MKGTAAMELIVFGLLLGLYFRYFRELPELDPSRGGGRGEVAGPVEFFRLPIYIFCGLCVPGGMGILVWSFFEGGGSLVRETATSR